MRSPIDGTKQPVLWAGMRQFESVFEALNSTLNSLNGITSPTADARGWLKGQGIENLPEYGDASLERAVIWTALFGGFEHGFGTRIQGYVLGSRAPGPGMVNLGEDRSGAGWRDPANFLITSAFVRLLGAWEQFEIDVVKALLYYRPNGVVGPSEELIEVVVDYRLVSRGNANEGTNGDEAYAPALWAWVANAAKNNEERRKILERVFGVLTPFDGKETSQARSQRADMYEKRNKIVHGRAAVSMTLPEFIDSAVFIAKSMESTSRQCRERLKVLI